MWATYYWLSLLKSGHISYQNVSVIYNWKTARLREVSSCSHFFLLVSVDYFMKLQAKRCFKNDVFSSLRLSCSILVHRHLVTVITLICEGFIDDDFLVSPKRQHIDDSSSQAKEVIFCKCRICGHTFIWLGDFYGVFFVLFSFFQSLSKRFWSKNLVGEKILEEYAMTAELKDRTRRDLANILVADMVEKYG